MPVGRLAEGEELELSDAQTAVIVARVIAALQYESLDLIQAQIFSGGVQIVGPFEVVDNSPQFRITDYAQTDPAGRYRLRNTGDRLLVERAATAAWATATELVRIDEAAGDLQVTLSGGQPELRFHNTDTTPGTGEWRFRIIDSGKFFIDNSSTGDFGTTRALIGMEYNTIEFNVEANFIGTQRAPISGQGTHIYAKAASITPQSGSTYAEVGIAYFDQTTFTIATPGAFTINDAATVFIANAPKTGGTGSPTIDRAWALYLKAGKSMFSDNIMLEDADAHLRFGKTTAGAVAWKLCDFTMPTIAIGTEISYRLAADGTDMMEFYTESDGSAGIQNHGVNILATTTVPTTTSLPAGMLRYVVDGSDQLTAYWNDAGTVRSLVIGTLS